MIYEYALDPAFVASSTDRIVCNLLKDSFGLGKGRLVSRFPGKWKKQVWQAYEEVARTRPDTGKEQARTQFEKERLTELLQRLSDTFIKRENYVWNPDEPWLPNVTAEHKRIPFRAILSQCHPGSGIPVITTDDLSNDNERWNIRTGVPIPRKAGEMSTLVAPILWCCEKVVLVDPHFNPCKYRYRQPLGLFLDQVVSPLSIRAKKQIELHCTGKIDCDKCNRKIHCTNKEFGKQCARILPEVAPAGLKLRIIRWKERADGEALHNRYILTDVGGVDFGHGLDEGKEGHTDDVHLLDNEQYRLRWSQYMGEHPAFDPEDDPIEIIGRA